MPGLITTDLKLIQGAEVVANYVVLGTFASTQALNDDVRVEGTNAINGRVSANSAWSLGSGSAAIDMTPAGTHVYMWLKNLTWPAADTKANGGIGISISSDTAPTLTGTSPSNGPTNSKTWYLAGSDTDLVTGWVCYCVDPNGTPDLTLGTPVISTVNRVGLRAKIVGTVSNKTLNIQHDIIRYGSGLTIVSGTVPAPVDLVDIFTEDSKSTNAWGVLTFQNGIYFCAGSLRFGTSDQTVSTYFNATNKLVVYQNFPVSSTLYGFVLTGSAGFGTTVQFGKFSGSIASDGCVLKTATTTSAKWNIVTAGNSSFKGYNSTFDGLGSATFTTGSELRYCSILNGGTVVPAGSVVDNCSFSAHTSTQMRLVTGSDATNVTNCSFFGNATQHGIEITTVGTYAFNNIKFSGYGADGTTSAAVFNSSSGSVTINVTGGGSTPTVRNGTGSSTVINSNVNVTLTGLKNPTEIRVFDAGTQTERAGTGAENVVTGTHTFSLPAGTSVDISILALGYQNTRLLSYSTTVDATVPISQQLDRQYENP